MWFCNDSKSNKIHSLEQFVSGTLSINGFDGFNCIFTISSGYCDVLWLLLRRQNRYTDVNHSICFVYLFHLSNRIERKIILSFASFNGNLHTHRASTPFDYTYHVAWLDLFDCVYVYTLFQFSGWKAASKKKNSFASSHTTLFIPFRFSHNSIFHWSTTVLNIYGTHRIIAAIKRKKSIWNNIRLSIIIFCYSKHALWN